MVTTFLPSGQSLVSITNISLQLTLDLLYNEEYSINITAQKCAGSNSTIVTLINYSLCHKGRCHNHTLISTMHIQQPLYTPLLSLEGEPDRAGSGQATCQPGPYMHGIK